MAGRCALVAAGRRSGVASPDPVRRRGRVQTVARDSRYPEAADWADYYLHARATDAEVMGIFGPRDGRA